MSIIKRIFNEKGIGLVETIVALGVSIVVLTSLVSLSLYTLRSSQQSRYMLEASKLATEELERVRAVRDSSAVWSTFRTSMLSCTTSLPCRVSTSLAVVSAGSSPYTDPENSNYGRYFTVSETPSGSNILRIAVTVTYTIGGQTKYIRNYTDLTNWRNN
jgi:Tfp pilus assembly protein PilV